MDTEIIANSPVCLDILQSMRRLAISLLEWVTRLPPSSKLAVPERIQTENPPFAFDQRTLLLNPHKFRLAAAAIAEACTKTILAEGLKAIEISFGRTGLADLIRTLWTLIVWTTIWKQSSKQILVVSLFLVLTLVLSGLGFENGGVSGAHALGVGVTALPNMEKKYLHGEMVALGVMTELVMENRLDECKELAEFFSEVGLPVCWKQMGVDVYNDEQVHTMLNSCFEKFYAIKNMPVPKTIPVYQKGMQDAEAFCSKVLESKGQAKWLQYHPSSVCETNNEKRPIVQAQFKKERGLSGLR